MPVKSDEMVGSLPYDEFIKHYGVKGMKWGVRKDRGRVTTGSKKTRKQQASEREMRRADNNRRVISTPELESRIRRIKLERELKKLTEQELDPGKTFAKAIMSQAGRKVLSAAVAGGMAYGAKQVFEKAGGKNQASSYLFPNPNRKK